MSQSFLEGVTNPFASGAISLLTGLAVPQAVFQSDSFSLTDLNLAASGLVEPAEAQQARPADADHRSGSSGDALSAAGDIDADYDKIFDDFPASTIDMDSIRNIDQGIGDGLGFEGRHPGPVEAGPFQEHGEIAVAPLPQAVVGAMGMLLTLAGCRHARRKALENAPAAPRRL